MIVMTTHVYQLACLSLQTCENKEIEETGTSGLLLDMKHYNCDNKYLCYSTLTDGSNQSKTCINVLQF